MIAAQAHLDPRFKNFPNLPEDEYESILAVPILARGERLEGALNVRTREPRAFSTAEIDLLLAIAAQVAQSIEHAKLYAQAQRRGEGVEALAPLSPAGSRMLLPPEAPGTVGQDNNAPGSGDGAALRPRDRKNAHP